MGQDTPGKSDKTAQPKPEDARKARLTAALRENLKKRKAQSRARSASQTESDQDSAGRAEKQDSPP